MGEVKPQRMPEYLATPAGWYPDPWGGSESHGKERWWTGALWTDKVRQHPQPPVRDNVSVLED